MEENEIIEEVENALDPKMQKAIEAKVAELKAENPKKRIYPLLVEGVEGDEKDVYVGYFEQPSLPNFSKYLTISQKQDQAVAMRQLAKDCFLAGDRELIDDDSLFLFGLMGQLQHIIKMRGGRLVNLSKPGK